MPGAGERRLGTATEEAQREPDQAGDQGDLEQQAEHGGGPREPAEEAVPGQDAEQAGAQEAGHQAGAEAEAARGRGLRL